jgi:hypothetical protein
VIAELVADLIGLVGALLISYGAWCVFPPAGFIVGGALLVIAAAVLANPRK